MTVSTQVPYLLRAARGEVLERPPVWMMRQAGRYMKEYRELRDKYPSFRERSENPEIAIEISLQPFRAFQPDGVILFQIFSHHYQELASLSTLLNNEGR